MRWLRRLMSRKRQSFIHMVTMTIDPKHPFTITITCDRRNEGCIIKRTRI